MTWTRLMVHWIVNDCDLGEVSVYTPSKGCVGLRTYGLLTGVRGHVANMYVWNSPITTVIRRVYEWHHMRHCMGGHVGHR